jgi:Domain of unknown function (DUF4328)
MRCTRCGADIPIGAASCPQCLTPVNAAPADAWQVPGSLPPDMAPTATAIPAGYPPPGWVYPPVGYAPVYSPPPRPVQGLGAAVIVLASVQALLQIVLLLLRLGSSRAAGGVEALSVLAQLALIVVALIWFHRTARNAQQWGPHRRAVGWAVWAWFVPVVNLWFPYQIATDTARASVDDPRGASRTVLLIRLWWAAWILAWLTGFRSTDSQDADLGDSDVRTGANVHAQLHGYLGETRISALIAAVAAILLVLVVRNVTAAQNARLGVAPRR